MSKAILKRDMQGNWKASTKARSLKEAKNTQNIRRLLSECGIWHFKHWSGMGSRPGVSDILGILEDGRFLAIEVKAGGNRPSEEQANFLKEVNDAGGVGFVAYSTDDVIKALSLPVLI